ncbi:hypothetical protein GYMLUDRAFT_145929, partial [Collybiopsis luxurians FD-317 M1]
VNYLNFQQAMTKKYWVAIKGWPQDVPFKSPHNLDNDEHISTLYQAWKTGEAYWYKLSERQYQKHLQQLSDDERAGIPTKVARKQRSDAG